MGDFFISIDELKRVLGTPCAPRLFDVRRHEAYGASPHVLPTARWTETRRFERWDAATSKRECVVLYCEGGQAASQGAASVLREKGVDARVLAGGFEGWQAAGGLLLRKAALPGRDEDRASRWVTRVRPKIDRIACPWLIRRFIDPDAQFYFVEPAQVVAAAGALQAIAYDIVGVEFAHEGERCTFDTLLDRFGLSDPALQRLALIVRGADTARLDMAPEAAGLLAVSLGNSAIAGGDDHQALALGFPVYDALLAWLRHASAETHNWPAKGN